MRGGGCVEGREEVGVGLAFGKGGAMKTTVPCTLGRHSWLNTNIGAQLGSCKANASFLSPRMEYISKTTSTPF